MFLRSPIDRYGLDSSFLGSTIIFPSVSDKAECVGGTLILKIFSKQYPQTCLSIVFWTEVSLN